VILEVLFLEYGPKIVQRSKYGVLNKLGEAKDHSDEMAFSHSNIDGPF
jgi:hypothetical protein